MKYYQIWVTASLHGSPGLGFFYITFVVCRIIIIIIDFD